MPSLAPSRNGARVTSGIPAGGLTGTGTAATKTGAGLDPTRIPTRTGDLVGDLADRPRLADLVGTPGPVDPTTTQAGPVARGITPADPGTNAPDHRKRRSRPTPRPSLFHSPEIRDPFGAQTLGVPPADEEICTRRCNGDLACGGFRPGRPGRGQRRPRASDGIRDLIVQSGRRLEPRKRTVMQRAGVWPRRRGRALTPRVSVL